MSHFVIIELFLKFMSEGFGADSCRAKIRDITKLSQAYIRRTVAQSPEAQEAIKARKEKHYQQQRFSTGVDTWV